MPLNQNDKNERRNEKMKPNNGDPDLGSRNTMSLGLENISIVWISSRRERGDQARERRTPNDGVME